MKPTTSVSIRKLEIDPPVKVSNGRPSKRTGNAGKVTAVKGPLANQVGPNHFKRGSIK